MNEQFLRTVVPSPSGRCHGNPRYGRHKKSLPLFERDSMFPLVLDRLGCVPLNICVYTLISGDGQSSADTSRLIARENLLDIK
jgi:hypothetical protein